MREDELDKKRVTVMSLSRNLLVDSLCQVNVLSSTWQKTQADLHRRIAASATGLCSGKPGHIQRDSKTKGAN